MEGKPGSHTTAATDATSPASFPPSPESGGKITPSADKGGSPKTSAILGHTEASALPKDKNSWGKASGTKKGKPKPTKKQPKSHTPTVTPTPGPMGYLTDCANFTDGDLMAAYPSEYGSFKKRKEYATTKPGWHWAKEWTKFRDFLRDMGPKPEPHYTLERPANKNKAYGPGLCIWAGPTIQNNNKSDNVKIVVPLTGEVYTVKKLASVHKKNTATVYGWITKEWSVLELLVGKRLPHLSAFIAELAELPPPPSKNLKTPIVWADASRLKKPDDAAYWRESDIELWADCDRDCGGDEVECRKLYAEFMAQRAKEYSTLIDWIGRHNAGLPCSPEPPQGKFYQPRLRDSDAPPSPPTASSSAHEPHDHAGYEENDDGFDPADSHDPADYGHYDDDD